VAFYLIASPAWIAEPKAKQSLFPLKKAVKTAFLFESNSFREQQAEG
jgi:hypothetical protein